VHGWSVRDTVTYGGLPERLKREAKRHPELGLDLRQIWLSEYMSFHNEVGIPDIARAFQAALEKELGRELRQGRRFACITQSTGGPVVRTWLQQNYLAKGLSETPLSHLIMLAPANFGSALVQLGLAKLSRLRAWFDGVEVGTGVLDWLEIGSPESYALNLEWLKRGTGIIGPAGVFPFVLAGQSRDPLLYDAVNSYTGETGSDGVVRSASANLNFTHLRLEQQTPVADTKARQGFVAPRLASLPSPLPPAVPFALLPGLCHSEARMGIMRSVPSRDAPHPTVAAILECLAVHDMAGYARCFDAFKALTAETQAREQVEDRSALGPYDHQRINDPCSMLVFRVRDDQGNTIKDFDLVLTAGPEGDPNHLPPGFFIDRQRNHLEPGTVTYYVNHSRLCGAPAVMNQEKTLRPTLPGCTHLGLRVIPYPQDGFVHYLPAVLPATPEHLTAFLKPNQTTLIDVVLRRFVREGVYRLTRSTSPRNFTKQPPGLPVK
jgi:hypothetical protein